MASHMGKGAKPTNKSAHGIIVAIVGFALLVCGIVMVVFSFAPDPTSDGRPQERVRAELSHTEHEANRHYESGYKWWGVYQWSYQGSDGYYEDSKGYESEVEVPKHHTVRVYLGQDDAWHTLDRREAGGLLVGGLALAIAGIAATVFGILMKKTGVGF